MTGRLISLGVLALVGAIVLGSSCYTVSETQQVIITQFGKPVGDVITESGLHFKTPFVQDANYFEKRIMEWDGFPRQITTRDKKYIHVDTFARWRISDPLKYFRAAGTEEKAQSRLDGILDGITADVVTDHVLIELVRSTNRPFEVISEDGMEEEGTENALGEMVPDEGGGADQERQSEQRAIEFGRAKLAATIASEATAKVSELGIELIDVRIKRVNYVAEVRRKVYDRMISERNRIAEKFRSEGRGIRAEWLGKKERELKRITSEAYRTAQEIRGRAEAEATGIYAETYGKDPEFYEFWRTLESYKKTIGSDTTLILGSDAAYFKFLTETQ